MSDLGYHTVAYFKLKKAKSSGTIRAGSTSKAFDASQIEADWYRFTEYLKQNKIALLNVTPQKAFQSAISSIKDRAASSVTTDVEFKEYANIQEFVEDNLEQAGIVIDELGRVDTDKSENSIDYLYVLADQYNKYAKAMNWAPVNVALIDRVMSMLRFNIPKQKIDEIRQNVEYDPECSDKGFYDIVKLLRPMDKDPDLEIHASALKHYVWQIKRKLAGDIILDPLMIYVHGNQGIGKSSLVRHLNKEILGEFYSEQEVSDALDTRSAESKQNYYSILADEISYCDDATVAKIKKLLTSTAENARILGTNAVMKVRNNTTWAATSNHSLMTTIYDETGLRRFWEIPCTIPQGEVLDFDKLSTIDVLELWKSVDESRLVGYYNRELPTWDAMQAHQNKSVAKSNAQAFLYTQGFLQSDDSGYCWCKGSDLFRLYTDWAKDNNIKSKGSSRIWFDRKLKQLGIQSLQYDREEYFWLNGGSGQVEISKQKAPTGASVTVPKSENPELQKLINSGFSKRDNVEKLTGPKGDSEQ